MLFATIGQYHMDEHSSTLKDLERRNLTVMECDLVGSTRLSNRIDPEQLREILVRYQDSVVQTILKHGGFFAQFAGDAIWAYFGYPRAKEDDAIRAIRAGLEISRKVQKLSVGGESLEVRVGIASGLCVVGDIRPSNNSIADDKSRYIAAIGDPPNLAARIQSATSNSSVVVSESTRVKARQAFKFQNMGSHTLKGFDGKIRIWRVIEERKEKNRFKIFHPVNNSILVGRNRELSVARKSWKKSICGNTQVLFVSGEPGIGKSRFVSSFVNDIGEKSCQQLWMHSAEHLQDSAFSPVISMLTSLAEKKTSDNQPNTIENIKKSFSITNDVDLGLLLELILPESCKQTVVMSPKKRQKRMNDILVRVIERECSNSPLLLIFEDVQWSDHSSKLFINHLIEKSGSWPLLIILTSRDVNSIDFPHSDKNDICHLPLKQLKTSDASILVNSLWQECSLPISTLNEIVKRTDGVPLFIEDVTLSLQKKALAPSRTHDIDAIGIPNTLSDHLMSRIDELGKNKQIAQAASVIGRDFTFESISTLTDLSSEELKVTLGTLVNTGLLVFKNLKNDVGYSFKHALIQDAAYNSLLLTERKKAHLKIAKWLVSVSPNTVFSQPEIVAYHFEKAEEYDEAVKYWYNAGLRFNNQCNFNESVEVLNKAYSRINESPDSHDIHKLSLDIVTALGASYAGISGFSSEQTGKMYEKAMSLCQSMEYTEEIYPILSGAGSYYLIRSEFDNAKKISDKAQSLAMGGNKPIAFVSSKRIDGALNFFRGEFQKAHSNLTTAVNTYGQDTIFSNYYALDLKTSSLCYLSLVNLMQHNESRLLDCLELALTHSKGINPHAVNYTLCYKAAAFYMMEKNVSELLQVASESLAISIDEGFPTWTGFSRAMVGHAMMRMGDLQKGMDEVELGLREYRNLEAKAFLPFAESLSARGHMLNDENEKALGVLQKSYELSLQTSEIWYLPEILRLQAICQYNLGRIDKFRKTITEAKMLASNIGAALWLQRISKITDNTTHH